MKRTFIYTDEQSNKFWTIEVTGNSFTVSYGGIGSKGQTQIKEFDNEVACQKAADKLIAEKTKKGYVENDLPQLHVSQSAKPIKVKSEKERESKKKEKEKENTWISDEKIWDYYALNEIDFDIVNLKDPNYIECSEENEEEEEEEKNIEKKENGELTEKKLKTLYKESNLESVIIEAAKAGNMEHLIFAFETEFRHLTELNKKHGKELKSERYNPKNLSSRTLQSVLNFDSPYTENTVDVIKWLLEAGAKVEKNSGDKYCGRNFVTEYLKDPKPERVSEIFETYIDEKFKLGFKQVVHEFRTYLNAVRNSEEIEEIDDIPKGKFPKNFVGFEIVLLRAYGDENLYVHSLDIESECIVYLRSMKRMSKGVIGVELNKYLKKYFVLELGKIAKEGLFDGLFESGVVMFTLKGSDEPLFVHITRPEIKEEFEDFLKCLETGNNWTENIDSVPVAFYFLTKGVFGKKDEDRAYRLVKRYLYNCDNYMETQKIFYWMTRMEKGYPNMNYLIAEWRIINKNFDWATPYIQKIERTDVEGAKKIKQLLSAEKAKGELLKKPKAKTDDYVPCFDISTAKDMWKNAKFEQIFTEENLYQETKNIIARARTNGNIYIRFIDENETGYGEALDFINGLLEKGYAYLSGGANKSEGYAINVRFLNKPIFVEEVVKIKNECIGKFPKTTCHAFFTRAVQYPELREKVVAYIERAVNKHTWYMDIQHEPNTLPGTFAVAALMLCDKKYLPLVSLFANNVDDEHMYTQLSFPLALVNHYGNDIDLAPMLYDLSANAGFDRGPSKISNNLLYNPEFFKKVLDYSEVDIDDEDSLEGFYYAIEYLYGDKGKSNLKKIRDLLSKTNNEQEKAIFTQFHNVYLEALKLDGDEEFEKIKPISSEVDKDVIIKTYPLKDQDAVISLKEAKKRGYTDLEESSDTTIIFFSPALITDSETARNIKQQWKNIGLENSKPWSRNQCEMSIIYGKMSQRFEDWVISSNDLKYDCGVIISDGEKKPMILYGEVDALAIGKAVKKRWPKKSEDAEKVRQTYLIRESKLRNNTELWIEEDELFENSAASYFSNWFMHTAKIILPKTSKDKPESYLSSKIMQAHLAELDSDIKLMKELYTELVSLQPEEKEYWGNKIKLITDK